jgi:hypothetical protein
MDNNTLSEKLSTMSFHRLVTLHNTPVWQLLLDMLRPTDIISLVRATMFCLRPTEQQINIYMQWWRQTFYNIKFVKKNAIYCFGKDLHLLKTAIQRWDSIEANKIKLLALVKETDEGHELRNTLLESLDTPYMWNTNLSNLLVQYPPVQTCIILLSSGLPLLSNGIWLQIDAGWSADLCLEEVRRRQVRPGNSTLRTYFTDLRRPNVVDRVDGDNVGLYYRFIAMNTLVEGTVNIRRIGHRALKVSIEVNETTWTPPEQG